MRRTLTTSGLMGEENIQISCSFKVGTRDGECKELDGPSGGLQLRKQRTLVSRTGKEQEQ
jgi:hypothetical protein